MSRRPFDHPRVRTPFEEIAVLTSAISPPTFDVVRAVNHILTAKHGKRIAIIENEFGEVGVDDGLVVETKEEIFEMNNGCICCTVRQDLIRILNKLMRRKDAFDHIIIETTGLADPAPVAQTFFVDEDLKEDLYLDAILTVVDAAHLSAHLDEIKPEGVENESVEQIAFADKILLNKIDLLKSDDDKASLVKKIDQRQGRHHRISTLRGGHRFYPWNQSVQPGCDVGAGRRVSRY